MRKIFLVFLLIAVAPSVFAQDWREGNRGRDRYSRYYRRDNAFEITPFVGYRWGGTIYADTTNLFDRDVEAASSGIYGLTFGIPVGTSGTKLELMVNRQDTHLTSGGGLFEPNDRIADFHVTHYHAGVLVPFAQSRNASPFVVLSAGVGNLDPDINGVAATNRFSASAGLGVKVPVNPNFGVRLEGRGYFTSTGNNNSDRCYRCDFNNGHDFFQGEVNLGFVLSF